jgi:hypothetical protein
MALIDRVTERITNDLLVKLTNPDAPAEITVNTTYLQQTCDDVEDGEFEAYMGEDYDEAVAVHILAAVLLVRLRLIEQGAAPNIAFEKLRAAAEKRIEKYKNIRARDRVVPQSTSQLTPSEEVRAGETRRPEFDNEFFTEIIPEDQGAPLDLD